MLIVESAVAGASGDLKKSVDGDGRVEASASSRNPEAASDGRVEASASSSDGRVEAATVAGSLSAKVKTFGLGEGLSLNADTSRQWVEQGLAKLLEDDDEDGLELDQMTVGFRFSLLRDENSFFPLFSILFSHIHASSPPCANPQHNIVLFIPTGIHNLNYS